MAEEIQRVRGCAMTFADVDLIFSRSKLYIVSTV